MPARPAGKACKAFMPPKPPPDMNTKSGGAGWLAQMTASCVPPPPLPPPSPLSTHTHTAPLPSAGRAVLTRNAHLQTRSAPPHHLSGDASPVSPLFVRVTAVELREWMRVRVSLSLPTVCCRQEWGLLPPPPQFPLPPGPRGSCLFLPAKSSTEGMGFRGDEGK